MGCCNAQREALDGVARGRAVPAVASRQVAIRFLGQGAVVVAGPMTGLRYAFSASAPRRAVDARDAAGLLRTRLFAGG